jgi:hypothetical protein
MRWEVKDLKYGEIVYEKRFFKRDKKIILNGMEMTKEIGNTYTCPYGDEEIRAKVRGNIFTGVKMKIEDDSVVLVQMIKWYELLLAFLIPVIVFFIGKKFIPLYDGILQGIFAGLVSVFGTLICTLLIKKMNHIGWKIFVWIGILVAVVLLSYSFNALFN